MKRFIVTVDFIELDMETARRSHRCPEMLLVVEAESMEAAAAKLDCDVEERIELRSMGSPDWSVLVLRSLSLHPKYKRCLNITEVPLAENPEDFVRLVRYKANLR